MPPTDEVRVFATDSEAPVLEYQYWTVLIVDDDSEIHQVRLLAPTRDQ